MVGDYISGGATGWVFEHNREPDKVIKVMKAFPRVGSQVLDAFEYNDYLADRHPTKYNPDHRDYDHTWSVSMLWRPMSAKMQVYLFNELMSFQRSGTQVPTGLVKVFDSTKQILPLKFTKNIYEEIAAVEQDHADAWEDNFLDVKSPGHRMSYLVSMEKLNVPEGFGRSRLRPRVEVFKEVSSFLWDNLYLVTRDTAAAGNYGFRANKELVIFDPIVAPLPSLDEWKSADVYERLRYNYFSYLFTEEPFPIDDSFEARGVNRKIRNIEKQLANNTFTTVERDAESFAVEGFPGSEVEGTSLHDWSVRDLMYSNSVTGNFLEDQAKFNYGLNAEDEDPDFDGSHPNAQGYPAFPKNNLCPSCHKYSSRPLRNYQNKIMCHRCETKLFKQQQLEDPAYIDNLRLGKYGKYLHFEAPAESMYHRDSIYEVYLRMPNGKEEILSRQHNFNMALAQMCGLILGNKVVYEIGIYGPRLADPYYSKDLLVRHKYGEFTGNDPDAVRMARDNCLQPKGFDSGFQEEFEAPAPKQTKVKFPRAKADKIVTKVENHLRPMVEKMMACGSYRRGAQMIGDIDFVIIPKEGYTLPNMLPPNEGINWVGENKAQVIIDGEKVDFKVTTPAAWGATILYFTGPADFNIKYRWMAKRKGLKLSEYGLFDRNTDQYLAGATEADIFTALGRPYKDPAQRQGFSKSKKKATKKAEDNLDYRDYLNDLRTYPELKNLSDEQLLARGIDCLALQTANRESFSAQSELGPICPICYNYIPNNQTPGAYPGALARYDNETEICSECGTAEALAGMMAGPEAIAEWESSDRTWRDYQTLIMTTKSNIPEIMFGRGPEMEKLRELQKEMDEKKSEGLIQEVFNKRELEGGYFDGIDQIAEGMISVETPMAINLSHYNYEKPFVFEGLGSLFGAESKDSKVFGVQRHDAHRAGLHYDLRLERDGVLKSWSIPKGMPTDNRHLAIATDDHQMSWLDFDGDIPDGSYGAGKVSLDNKSTFQTVSYSPKKWVFYVNDGKYQGKYTLVHWQDNKWLISRNKNQSMEAETREFNAWYDLATEKQRNYIKRLGRDPHPDLNRRQASKIINQLAREKKALDQIDIVAEEE